MKRRSRKIKFARFLNKLIFQKTLNKNSKHSLSGYGNIAPKTLYGRVVTMLYALIGMPLFLLWASQMGTLLASVFKVCYYNICCGLCRRGKRRKAMALYTKNKRQEEKEKLQGVCLKSEIFRKVSIQTNLVRFM